MCRGICGPDWRWQSKAECTNQALQCSRKDGPKSRAKIITKHRYWQKYCPPKHYCTAGYGTHLACTKSGMCQLCREGQGTSAMEHDPTIESHIRVVLEAPQSGGRRGGNTKITDRLHARIAEATHELLHPQTKAHVSTMHEVARNMDCFTLCNRLP